MTVCTLNHSSHRFVGIGFWYSNLYGAFLMWLVKKWANYFKSNQFTHGHSNQFWFWIKCLGDLRWCQFAYSHYSLPKNFRMFRIIRIAICDVTGNINYNSSKLRCGIESKKAVLMTRKVDAGLIKGRIFNFHSDIFVFFCLQITTGVKFCCMQKQSHYQICSIRRSWSHQSHTRPPIVTHQVPWYE